jgi:hypothetical protein
MGGRARRGTGDGAVAAYLVVLVLWALATVGFVALVVVSWLTSDEWCSDSETSAVGRAHWSWTELGRICTWNGPEGTYQTGHGMGSWAILIGLVAMGVVLVLAGRWIRRARRRDGETSDSETPAVAAAARLESQRD